jgi:hypothetical protein
LVHDAPLSSKGVSASVCCPKFMIIHALQIFARNGTSPQPPALETFLSVSVTVGRPQVTGEESDRNTVLFSTSVFLEFALCSVGNQDRWQTLMPFY